MLKYYIMRKDKKLNKYKYIVRNYLIPKLRENQVKELKDYIIRLYSQLESQL